MVELRDKGENVLSKEAYPVAKKLLLIKGGILCMVQPTIVKKIQPTQRDGRTSYIILCLTYTTFLFEMGIILVQSEPYWVGFPVVHVSCSLVLRQ